MDKNLALEFVRVTESAAIAAAQWIGKGEKNKADEESVNAMRDRFNAVDFRGTIVIGEGRKDDAPELYVGERVGTGKGPEMDIAVDPLECTDSVAWGRYNALSVIATGPRGSLFGAPDTYMDKIAVGPRARSAIDLDAPVSENISRVARALGKDATEITVSVLDRPRHAKLIDEIRQTGARIRLITDGDVATAIATCLPQNPIDILLGAGGSAEAVLAAVAVKILGGAILARLRPRNEGDREEMQKMGLDDSTIYDTEDLARGDDLTFTATGVIEGPLLPGVLFGTDSIVTHSVVMRSISRTVRYITTYHHIKAGEEITH